MKITNMKINGIINPIGFVYDKVLCSWTVEDTDAKKQEYVKIEVSKDQDFSTLYYCKAGKHLSSVEEKLEMSLAPRTTYFYRITVIASNGKQAVSEVSYFETAKLAEPWSASWVGPQMKDKFHPVIRKKFNAMKKIKRARVYICGLGVYEAYLNNQKVGEEYLAPFVSDYITEFQYQTYDLTKDIQVANVIDIYLGNGWYKGKFGLENKSNLFGDQFSVIAEIHLEYIDDTCEVIKTDQSWEYCGSDIESSGIYDGEVLNRLLWDQCNNDWKQVMIMDLDKKKLIERISIPVIVKEEILPKEIIQTPLGEFVLDMGQNFTGYLEFQADLPRGTKIILNFGEVLQDGNFYSENYRTAKSEFVYISSGEKEVISPRFTFFGFRYVRVLGWVGELKKEDFIGKVVYSDLSRTGYFTTSNSKINRLYENSLWGQKSNFLDIPTDCPQRDERLGWTGDAQVFAKTASYHMDTRAFYRKFLHDVRVAQLKINGAVPHYIPNIGNQEKTSSVWGDAATFVPTTLLELYGNIEEMEGYYPLMKDWVDYITRQDEQNGKHYLYQTGFHFGDWLALDGITPQSFKGGTDDYYIASMYYYRSAKMVSDMAKKLGEDDEAKAYLLLSEKIKAAIIREYFTSTGRLAIDTQTAYLIALRFRVFLDKEKLIGQFKERLRKDCFKIKCGFVGAPLLCSVLAENGMESIAYDFLFQEEFPSWLYGVNLGATTIWERWNSLLEDGSISGTGMNSLNHYAYGSVVEFMYSYMAGIKPLKNGFQEALIAPKLDMKLRFVKCKYESVNGTYVINWEIKANGYVWIQIEVPFNCKAKVILPRSKTKEMILTSGQYEFEYQPTTDYRRIYNEETRLGQLLNDDEAFGIVREKLPIALSLMKSNDPEKLSYTLGSLKYKNFMGFTFEGVQDLIGSLSSLKRF